MVFSMLAGDAGSPVILHVPHASRELTGAARAGLVIDDGAVAEELDHLTDAYTDRIAGEAAERAGRRPWILVNRWSRLVVDPERLPDEREEMRAVGMGAVYTHGFAGRRLRDDDPVRDEVLLETHFRPYAEAMTALVADRLAATGRAVILDVHSYPAVALPYELHGSGRRPQICLGTDPDHTPAALVEAAQRAFARYDRALDTPFAGCYVPLRYGVDRAVSALMIEVRRDTYMREPGGAPGAGLAHLVAALTTLLDTIPA